MKTKDEMFILKAYQELERLSDRDALLNRYQIGRLAGISEKGVDAICNQLAKANFIKKVGEEEFRLTSNGERLAQSLLEG
jgi:Mn-dependent DtxR family transcriptional regulator